MFALRQIGALLGRRTLVPVAALSVALAGALGAQQPNKPRYFTSDDASQPPQQVSTPRAKGFKLFGLGDLGVAGMRMTGRFGWGTTSYGPCADGFLVQECGDVQLNNNAWQFSLFEMIQVAAAGPTDFAKITAAYPAAASAIGGGYVGHKNELLLQGTIDIGPADGQAGRLFSGVTTTDDGSCRDATGPRNGYTSTGFSLLPASDCPETWVGAFNGPRVFADSAFQELKRRRGAVNFRFNDWEMPAEYVEGSEFAGNFSTYGLMSDSFLEALQLYGKITKKGADLGFTNNPTKPGYPLGLDYRFEAFQYALPAIQNAVFYRLLVVNNSAKIYGRGIDYDSLYMGLSAGWGRGQGTAVYYVPSRNAILTTESGSSGTGNCNGARTAPGTVACGTTGFAQGATGVIMLKSPIGDNRNKLFTNPGSAFYDPTNPAKGDTITFNHGHLCGFGGCVPEVWQATERRQFGLISSTGANVLEGRSPTAPANANFYRVFRNVDFPTRTPQFNKYVPGNWDYNKDGVPDTLYYDTCHTLGCVKTWADTMPGTTRYTVRSSNVGGLMDAGPIKLKAGDTTEFIYAFVGAPDSASFERLVDAATDAYMSFFLVPKPPPVPKVTFTAVTPADSTNPVVRIGFSLEAATYTDPFIATYARNVRSSPDPRFRTKRNLNPTLADSLDARANNGGNLAEIQIYKSCDNGNTFTADADCAGDPLVNQSGSAIGTGWRPYAVLRPSASGIVPVFTDNNVIGGRTYLYSFVTKSKGFRAVIRDSVGGQIVATELALVDTAISPLARSGPTTAKVYVPLTLAAGAARATATVTNTAGSLGDNPITFRFADNVPQGNYRLVVGNRFVIREAISATTRKRNVTLDVQWVADSSVQNGTTSTALVVRKTERFTSDTSITISATPQSSSQVLVGDSTIITTVIRNRGVALVRADGRPYFVSTTLTGSAATPALFGARQDFPGFLITLDTTTTGLPNFERIITAKGDTVPVALQNTQNAALNLAETRTTLRSSAAAPVSGTYVFTFGEDAFGPGAPFANQGVAATEAALNASLNARPTATTGSTAAADSLAVVAAVGAGATSRGLVASALPFTVRNETFGRDARVVVPRRTFTRDTLRLGNLADTLSVVVPANKWIPGDTIFIVEDVQRDSIVGNKVVLDGSGNVIRVTTPRVTLGPLVLDCTNATAQKTNCNPLQQNTPGGTGYYDYAPNTKLVVRYPTNYRAGEEATIAVTPKQITPQVLTEKELGKVKVVPNPFVVVSQYNVVSNTRVGDARVNFTGVPSSGSIRIYSLSGQFLQEITWTPADLNGTGDLPYDLRTREGTDLASGLYIFVVKGRGQTGGTEMARGKFVVIR